ncbi:MAG: AMP-binding protein [Clostridiaceae bacterium]
MIFQIDQHPAEQMALIDDAGNRLSYGELVSHINTYPKVRSRAVIFVLAENRTSFVASLLALWNQGAIPLILSRNLERDLLDHLYETYRPAYFLAPNDLTPSLPGISVHQDMGTHLLETAHEPYPVHADLDLLLSTSGSTGSPKLVRFKRGNMESNAVNVAKVFGWTSQERQLSNLPLNYVMGLNAMLSHLTVGATVLLTDANLMEQSFWDFARSERATNFTGVPFSYELLLRLRPERMNLPHLTTFAQGGGKLSEKTFQKMAQLCHRNNWRFIATYGTTEASARCAFLSPELALDKTLSIGSAIPQVQLKLVDSQGQPVTEPHTEGELIVNGTNVSLGYAVCQSDLTRGDDFSGTYATGDLAWFDEDGCYYISGRTKRFVKLLGNRIGLDECEQILWSDCQINAVCIGKEDLLLILVPEETDAERLRTTLAHKLKLQPSLFQVKVHGTLPRNEAGKILYRILEQEYFPSH